MKKFMAATIVASTGVLSLGMMLPAMASEAPHSITSGDAASAISVDLGNVVNTENSRGGIQVKRIDEHDSRGAGVTLDGLFNRNGSGRGITAVTTDRDGTSTFGLNLGDVLGR